MRIWPFTKSGYILVQLFLPLSPNSFLIKAMDQTKEQSKIIGWVQQMYVCGIKKSRPVSDNNWPNTQMIMT